MKFKITYGMIGSDRTAERYWTSKDLESMKKALARFNLTLIEYERVS